MKKTIIDFIDNNKLEKFFIFLVLAELVLCLIYPEAESFKTFKIFFDCFEVFVIAVFAIEYALRVFTTNTLRKIFQPMMVIDLLTLLPVTGLIFLLALTGSSLFLCFGEQAANFSMAIKDLRGSSALSAVAFAIYCFDGHIPFNVILRAINSIPANISIFLQLFAILILGILLFDSVYKKYKEIKLKRSTIQAEPTFVDF